jgi:phosphopantothenoylcysteine decarboxylase/phosphopantothenate--cysteine ligase
MSHLKNRRILIGVSGGIAAYKSAQLVSLLRRADAEVQVVMTRSACEFITPLTLATLSGRPVYIELFPKNGSQASWEIDHITLADFAEIALIAPATANIIAKTAAGICDDLLSTTILALRCPVIFAPAMNSDMYENPILKDKIAYLESKGYIFVPPAEGELACGKIGIGRLPEPEDLLDFLRARLPSPQTLPHDKD